MANHCRSCKREISSNHATCYICGSSQNFILYYLKKSFLVLSFIIVILLFFYWSVNNNKEQVESQKLQLEQNKTNELIKQLQESQRQLKIVEENFSDIKQEVVRLNNSAKKQLKLQKEAEKKSIKVQKGNNWLAKENKQLKLKIKQLESQSNNISYTKKTDSSNIKLSPLVVSDATKTELAPVVTSQKTKEKSPDNIE